MTNPPVDESSLVHGEDSLIQRVISAVRPRPNGKRLRTRFLWYLLLSAMLAAYVGLNTRQQLRGGAGKVLLLGISAIALAAVVAHFARRETEGKISGNTYREYPISRLYQVARVGVAFLIVYVLERVDPSGVIIGHPATLVIALSFLLAVVFTLGWLIRYERQKGPVYVLRVHPERNGG